ncbi:MAG: hypothetical protein LBD66_00895, partial [Holosporales bacterium]|nr:hypothetical protein [Holosporales bacterium]
MAHFYKMQGLGNDFIIFMGTPLSSAFVHFLTARPYGIGADQVINLSLSQSSQPAAVSFFNADGRTAEVCGNGLRCVGLLLAHLTGCKTHSVRSKTRTHVLEVLDPPLVRASMGGVTFPATPSTLLDQQNAQDLRKKVLAHGRVEVGNPHLVFFISSKDTASLAKHFGPIYEKSLPQGV